MKRKRGIKGKPWFWDQGNQWCIKVDGTRVKLATGRENEAEATKKFHEMMIREKAEVNQDGNEIKTLGEEYLQTMEHSIEVSTMKNKTFFIQSFLDCFPGITVKQLKRFHITKWLADHPKWSESTKWTAAVQVDTVLNWAVKQGLITKNPIKGMPKPTLKSRGAEAVLDPADYKKLLDNVPQDMLQVFVALDQTSCRPKEIFTLEAADVDIKHKVWRLTKHKTFKKTKQVKTVPLTDTLLTLTMKLVLQHPEGAIFRKRDGKPWSTINFCQKMKYWVRKLNLKSMPTAYHIRHSMATSALEQGIPDSQVAAMLGHSNTQMLYKHYSHLTAKVGTIRNVIETVVNARNGTA